MVNEYEILEKIRNINEISEESKLESSVYFLLMNYFKLKEYTTKLDENNYIEYSNNNSKLFDIYFNHLDEYKYKYKLTDIQMNYLLESLICEPNSIYTKYNAYIYVNYDLRLLEINSSFKKVI